MASRRRTRFVVLALLVLLLLGGPLLWLGMQGVSPTFVAWLVWNQLGYIHIRRPAPVVIGGPVDLQLGAVGPIQMGMTRKEMIGLFGQPNPPRDLRPIRFDVRSKDHFDAPYGDLEWYGNDTVWLIHLGLDDFARRFYGELRVVVRSGRRQVVLSRESTLEELRAPRLWEDVGVDPRKVSNHGRRVHVREDSAILTLLFNYEDNHLSEVSVMLPNAARGQTSFPRHPPQK